MPLYRSNESAERISMDHAPSRTKSSRVQPPQDASFHLTNDLPCPEDKDLTPIPQATYIPDDISRIRGYLRNFVPTELADIIIDEAEIWPWVGVSSNSYTSAFSALEGNDSNAEWCYLVSPSVPSLERDGVRLPTEVKKVKFHIKSYSSCWGAAKPAQQGEWRFLSLVVTFPDSYIKIS